MTEPLAPRVPPAELFDSEVVPEMPADATPGLETYDTSDPPERDLDEEVPF